VDKTRRILESLAATSTGAGDESTNASKGAFSLFFPHTVRLNTNYKEKKVYIYYVEKRRQKSKPVCEYLLVLH